ncbi:MAG: hypothetical protein WCW78_01875 [Candidatus Paceibacterota bacterium]|jgi:hypothetical protein
MSAFYKWFFIVIAVAVYLNIGWAVDYKWHELDGKKPVTVIEKFICGPSFVVNYSATFSYENVPPRLITILFWPIILIIMALVWIIYFIIFGGIARLAGLA